MKDSYFFNKKKKAYHDVNIIHYKGFSQEPGDVLFFKKED